MQLQHAIKQTYLFVKMMIVSAIEIIKSVTYSLKFKRFWILFKKIKSSMLIKSNKKSTISSIGSRKPFNKHMIISSLMSMIWSISIWQMRRRKCMTALLTTKEDQIKSTNKIYFKSQNIWMLKMMQMFAKNIWKSWINFLRT